MVQDIIGRLRQVRLDIDRSPDFNNTATQKAQNIVDSVLNVFMRGNAGVIKWAGANNTASNIVNKFGLGSSNNIKNRLMILSNINTIQNKVRYNRMMSPETKMFIINKLQMIKGVR